MIFKVFYVFVLCVSVCLLNLLGKSFLPETLGVRLPWNPCVGYYKHHILELSKELSLEGWEPGLNHALLVIYI